jgi:hypothetical protein
VDDRLVAWGQELREVHRRLRAAFEIAVDSVEHPDPGQAARDLLLYCHGFCVALTGHHSTEDGALFPRILEERPDLAPVIDSLVRDHGMIDHLVRGLEAALAGGATPAERLRHLDGIGAIMESHFRYEERQLVAVLDAAGDLGADRQALLGPIA